MKSFQPVRLRAFPNCSVGGNLSNGIKWSDFLPGFSSSIQQPGIFGHFFFVRKGNCTSTTVYEWNVEKLS